MPNRPTSSAAVRLLGALACVAAASTATAAPSFVPEDQPIGYVAQPRSTSLDVRDGNQVAYYTDYERQHWSGNLKPFSIGPEGRLDADSDLWPGGTAPVLNTQHWDTERRIGTLKSDGTRIPFRYLSLDSSKGGQQDQVGSGLIVSYLRGNRANEAPNGTLLRARRYVLGDIIRSRPVYVAGTVPMIYVGANDGMLHAFSAETGEEVYAYVPSMLIPKLMKLAPLASAGYTHTHYVDASPRAMKVKIGGSTKRILVGGLGAGGRGLYALDITDDSAAAPATEQDAANKIMWEIFKPATSNSTIIVTNPKSVTATTAYNNLGHTYGEPIIGKSNYVISGSDRDVIFMPNGYMSTTGCASLFVINPANGARIREIVAGTCSTTSPNGLSSPTPVDTNGDGRIDLLYAGDLDGNMWKFDVSSDTPASWSVSKLFTTDPVQSITIGPAVADHPHGGRIVAFGTGRTLRAADMTDNSVHYMYGIWDGAPSGATLLTQTLSDEQAYVSPDGGSVRRVRTLSINAPNWTTHRGWKVAMPAGERFVGDRHTLTNGRVYGNTFNPTVNLGGLKKNPIEPVYENWKNQFSFLTGGGFTRPVFDLNMDGHFNDLDLLDDGPGKPANERVAASLFQSAGVASQPVVVTTTVGSQDLFTMNPDLQALALTDPGISGGHFDVDIYYPAAISGGLYTGYASRRHVHEYDDKYGVTGVNMMNASDGQLNLLKASFAVKRTSPQTPFKVLISHQYLNPAAQLRIGPSGSWQSVKDYAGQASTSDAQTVLDSAPTFTYDTIGHLVMGLPLDAFASKDWWGSGDVRAGLIPTQTGCVNKINDTNFVATPGPQGERHNGALVVQLIKSNTPASALQLVVAGKPQYGWRVKSSEYRKHMLALWTFFWHHPNGKCYGGSGWLKNPPQDPAGTKPGKPPPGTDDPRDGHFNAVGNNAGGLVCGGDLKSKTLTFNKETLTTTEVRTYSSGCTVTVVTVRDGSGMVTVKTTVKVGTQTETTTVSYEEVNWTPNHVRTEATIGRISWRELIRE